jgi:hypothetical protein
MGIDSKYGKVTVEKVRKTPIGEDEPVMVFRAQDKLLPRLLDLYEALCRAHGSPDEHIAAIGVARDNVVAWQEAGNHTQIPGS